MDIDCLSSVSFLFPENVYFRFVTLLKHESFVFFDIEPCTDLCNYIANRTGVSLNQALIFVRALVFDLPEKV